MSARSKTPGVPHAYVNGRITPADKAVISVFDRGLVLGDGLFVVFGSEEHAVTACIAIQERLQDKPVRPGGNERPVQMQMGIESGEVVEIAGDCYGDAVNTAARLADLAGAGQILTTQRVRGALHGSQQAKLRSLGPMYLRGKGGAKQKPQQPQGVGRHQERGAHVGGDRHPQRRHPGGGEPEDGDLDRQGDDDVGPDHPDRPPRVADEPGQPAEVVGHQGDVGGLDRGVAPRRPHGDG